MTSKTIKLKGDSILGKSSMESRMFSKGDNSLCVEAKQISCLFFFFTLMIFVVDRYHLRVKEKLLIRHDLVRLGEHEKENMKRETHLCRRQLACYQKLELRSHV